jgi:phage gp36-like protein
MAYTSLSNMLVVLPGLPQTTTGAGYTSTSAIVSAHIARADNLINGKIANRYNVTQFSATAIPPLLAMISEDITGFYTYRSLYSSDNQNFNEWTDKFKDAFEFLEQIRKGEVSLVDSSGVLIAEIESDGNVDSVNSNTKNFQPFFDEDDPLAWKIDEDKKDGISDNR